ncbi:MAG: hypothetical protein IJ113_08645 [Eggerthellaceae bacterium]|nr:hypothetical protein [Eggerthellaceae bacterium]
MAEKDNIYSFTRAEIARHYEAFFEGPTEAFFLVVCSRSLSQNAHDALEKSAAALGWTTGPSLVFADTDTLSKADIYKIIEGLDPVCLVLLGSEVQAKVADAYNCDVPTQGRFRLFGREACAFSDLDAMLEKESSKQAAWGLLRSLPQASQ